VPKIEGMISIATAAEYRQLRDDVFIQRRIVQLQLQQWERWATASAGEPSAAMAASLSKQSDEDLLAIDRELEALLEQIDSSWARRN
jgi:hypothetical protein